MLLCKSFSTSGARSRAISAVQMFPSAQSASPTMNWFEWFKSLQQNSRESPQITSGEYFEDLYKKPHLFNTEATTIDFECWSDQKTKQIFNLLISTDKLTLQTTGCCECLLLERIGDQHQHLLALIQEQHEPQVSNPLLGKAPSSNELDALHLAKMCGIAQHMNEHKLGHIAMPEVLIIVLECIPQGCTFFCHYCPLICRCFTSPDRPDHVSARKHLKFKHHDRQTTHSSNTLHMSDKIGHIDPCKILTLFVTKF